MSRLVIITGISGSGKSLAARCFEDLGFFCVDNLPVPMIPPLHRFLEEHPERREHAAVVVDVREKRFLSDLPRIIDQLEADGVSVQLLFFECSDNALKRRFSETRRPHPMAASGRTLLEAIGAERGALHDLRERADRIIDTTQFNAHELRSFLKNAYGDATTASGINVNVISFGFKYGLPTEADLVFDIRFLPNPYFVQGLRNRTGKDPEVRQYLDRFEETAEFRRRLRDLLGFLIPHYVNEGKTYLSVAVGCTGGKHRSVAIAEDLGSYFRKQGMNSSVTHRDLGRE